MENITDYDKLSDINASHLNVTNYDMFAGLNDSHMRAIFALDHVILPIICACGILGIILTIIVLSHKNMSTSTNCYLMALAIADLIFLVLLIPRLAENQFEPFSQAYNTYVIYTVYSIDIGFMFLLASIWLTVMLAVERYIAVCRPFLATKLCTVARARIFIVIIFVLAVLIRIVYFWQYTVTFYEHQNATWHFLDRLPFADHGFWHVYAVLVDVLLASVIPFIVLLVTNVLLIRAVRKSTRYLQSNQLTGAKSTSGAQREELQITVMLISVIVVFFLCQSPYIIYVAINSVRPQNTATFAVFKSVAMLLLTLKSAVNFILYCWFSERFRVTLKRTFCCKCCLKMIDKKGANPYGTEMVTEATSI